MKKLFSLLGIIIFMLTISSCDMDARIDCAPIYVFDTVISITIYNDSDYETYYNE